MTSGNLEMMMGNLTDRELAGWVYGIVFGIPSLIGLGYLCWYSWFGPRRGPPGS